VFEEFDPHQASALDVVWVLLVNCPLQWIVLNIRSYAMKVGIIADDVLIVIPLPDRFPRGPSQEIDSFRRCGFEPTYNGAKILRW